MANSFKIEFEGDKDLLGSLNAFSSKIFDRLNLLLKKIGREIVREARQNHKFTSRTGTLDRSMTWEAGDLELRVGIDTSIAKYGPSVHDGYGPRMIFPREKKVLRWPVPGGFAFASKVRHPGYKGDPFITNAYTKIKDSRIKPMTDQEVDSLLKEVGLK